MKLKVLSMFTYTDRETGQSVTCEQGAVAEVPNAVAIESIDLGFAREWKSGDADDISDLLPTPEDVSEVHLKKQGIKDSLTQTSAENAQAAANKNKALNEKPGAGGEGKGGTSPSGATPASDAQGNEPDPFK